MVHIRLKFQCSRVRDGARKRERNERSPTCKGRKVPRRRRSGTRLVHRGDGTVTVRTAVEQANLKHTWKARGRPKKRNYLLDIRLCALQPALRREIQRNRRRKDASSPNLPAALPVPISLIYFPSFRIQRSKSCTNSN